MFKLSELLDQGEDFTVTTKEGNNDVTYQIKVQLVTKKLLTNIDAGTKIIDSTFNHKNEV
jgi:hypothetical protein